MNTTLPPSRDLPPGLHMEIRGEVLATITPRQSRRWLAPLATAAAALVVVGLVAWFVPWGSGGTTAGGQPVTQSPSTVDGVAPDEVAAIEKGCARTASQGGAFTLRQVVTTEAGRFALLYGGESVLGCQLDDPAMRYNAGSGINGPFTAPGTADYIAGSSGGDTPYNKPVNAGQHGFDVAMGRVAPEVARVTFTLDSDKVEGVIANGTYIACIVHPSTWQIPENRSAPRVLAYDKNGTLLGELHQPSL